MSAAECLAVAGSALLLADMLDVRAPHIQLLAQGLDVVGSPLKAAGLAVIAGAFLGPMRSREGRLRTGLVLVALGYGAWCLSDAARAVSYARTHAATAYIAGHATLSVADLLVAVAAGFAAGAFSAPPDLPPAEARRGRDSRLGRSSVTISFGLLLAAISSALFFEAFPGLGATPRFTAGFAAAAAGAAIAMGGALIAAVAFQRSDRLPGFESLLGFAAAVGAVGLSATAIGGIVTVSAAAMNGFDGPSSIAAWLDVTAQLGWAAGIGVASVGFFRNAGEVRLGRLGWTVLLAGLCALAAALLLATGRGGTASPPRLSEAPTTSQFVSGPLGYGAFSRAADAICRSGTVQSTAVSIRISRKADAADAVALGQVIAILQAGERNLDSLSGPASLEAARDALVGALSQEVSSAEAASRAANADDQALYDSALGQVAKQIRTAHAAGVKLRAPACAASS